MGHTVPPTLMKTAKLCQKCQIAISSSSERHKGTLPACVVGGNSIYTVLSLKPYSDWISFTRVDGVMLIYHRTSVILMVNSHGIRNLSKTTRSGRSNSIYTPPSPPCRHVRATSIDLLIKL